MGKVFVGKTIFCWAKSFFRGQDHFLVGRGINFVGKVFPTLPTRFMTCAHEDLVGKVNFSWAESFFSWAWSFFIGHGHFLVDRVKFFVAKFIFWWSRSFCREGHLFRGQGFLSSWARSVGKNLEL